MQGGGDKISIWASLSVGEFDNVELYIAWSQPTHSRVRRASENVRAPGCPIRMAAGYRADFRARSDRGTVPAQCSPLSITVSNMSSALIFADGTH